MLIIIDCYISVGEYKENEVMSTIYCYGCETS